MMSEEAPRRKWFLTGCLVTGGASLGLMTFPLTYRLPWLSDGLLFSFVCALTVLMGIGATLAIFNFRRP